MVTQRKFALALVILAAGSMTLGCKAGVKPTPTPGTGGSGNGPGTGGTTGAAGSNGGPGFGGFGGSISINPDAGACQKDYTFEPKIPTVILLVDRSGSMFDSMAWEPLKAGVLSVVQQLQGQVRFGFSAFSGQSGGGKCPIFAATAPALNNYDAISAAYAPLGKLENPKGETPVGLALPLVEASLESPGNDGDKYILFVTDGEPDFCDDGSAVCPVDSTISHLQMLKAKGITTIVFGLKSTLSDISDATLQAFANAGAGQPVALPFGTQAATGVSVCDSCAPVLVGWRIGQRRAGLKTAEARRQLPQPRPLAPTPRRTAWPRCIARMRTIKPPWPSKLRVWSRA